MGGFQSLPQALQPVISSALPADQVAWESDKLTDETALAIVLADTAKAEAFVQSKNMVVDWERADNNFRAAGVPRNWPNSESMRSGLSMPVVLEAVEKLMPAVMLAFFSDKQPFLLERKGKTTDEVLRAKANLLMWAIKESNFKEEIRKALKGCLLYGFCALRWGWKTATRSKKSYGYEAGGKKVTKKQESYEISHPTLENIRLRNILFDPALQEQDCRKGRYAVAQIYLSAEELDDLRGDSTYKNIPSREELTQILAAQSEAATDSMNGSKYMTWRDNQAQKETEAVSVDPTKAPLEILEYVTEDRVITVLQRTIVIRNSKNEFDKSTFLSCAFIDVPGAMYGFGVSKLLQGEQYLQTHVLNKWMDGADLALNPAFTSAQGLQTTAQNVKITTGKIVTGPELKPIPVPDLGPSALSILQTSEIRAGRRVGANGGDNMPTQAMRTAEGVQQFGQDVVNKLQYFIEIFSDLVFVPALRAFLEVMHDNLQPEDIERILSEMDAKAYEGSLLDVYNGDCDILVLSSTKLAARRAAAQLIPMLIQLVQAPAVQEALAAQGKKFDFAELLEEAVDLAGWDVNSLIVAASQEEIQRLMQMAAPQAPKAQMDAQTQMQLQQQGQQNDLAKIEEQGVTRASVEVVKHLLKEASEKSGVSIG
jgi:hypothetical protein